MKWDVFISHASEDKKTIAEPLAEALQAAGLTVWLDKQQITLGDSISEKINEGLAHSEYGVVILSPSFFEKEWTQKELGAFLAQETGDGRKRILPVLYDMTFGELKDIAPLLAGVRGALWSQGVDSVTSQIVQAVRGGAAPVTQRIGADGKPNRQDLDALVMLDFESGDVRFVFADATSVSGDNAELTLLSTSAGDTAALSALSTGTRLGVAFGITAFAGTVRSATQHRSAGVERWTVELAVDPDPALTMEMSFADYSADKLAEMRARRILLNETPPASAGGSEVDKLNTATLEAFVRGMDGLGIEESPLPRLYSQFRDIPEFFVAVAKLAAVFALRMSCAVKHVHHLELRLLEGHRLSVRFEGVRDTVYVNVDPVVIRVEGECDLSTPDEANGG